MRKNTSEIPSKETLQKALEENSLNCTTVAKIFKLSYGVMYDLIAEYGLSHVKRNNRKTKYCLEDFQKAAEAKGGRCLSTEYSSIHIRLQYVCKNNHIFKMRGGHILEGQWCKDCADEDNRKYKINHDFFAKENDCEQSFYWAGFFAADGWKSDISNTSSGAYGVNMQLAEKDVEHLKKFRDLISPDFELIYRERPSTSGNGTICYSNTLKVNSKKMYNDLERFNIVHRKTYVYEMPDWLLTHPLLHHFLRGYIDGDGCFCYAENKDQTRHVNFAMKGTAKFLRQFDNIMFQENIIKNKHDVNPKDGKKYLAFDNLQYSGNGTAYRMYNYLYKNATLYLERKEKIARDGHNWAKHGTGRKKKPKCTNLDITVETLLNIARVVKTRVEIAEHFGCTPANITHHIRRLGIQEEIKKLLST